MKIYYVDKDQLYPSFGKAFWNTKIIWVRNDLSDRVKRFVLEHEKQHLKDGKMSFWWWGEIRANMCGMWKEPRGFITTVFLSLSPYRLLYYCKRIVKGE